MEIYVLPDPVVEAIEYLSQYFDKVYAEEPDSGDFDPATPYILVKDGGGQGVRAQTLLDSRLTFDIKCSSRESASDTAFRVAAVLREWQYVNSSVIVTNVNDSPKYFPDSERRLPAYIFTWGFAFRGKTENIHRK